MSACQRGRGGRGEDSVKGAGKAVPQSLPHLRATRRTAEGQVLRSKEASSKLTWGAPQPTTPPSQSLPAVWTNGVN